jgi:hypothetical protein
VTATGRLIVPDYPPEVLAAIDVALDELPDPDSPFERDRWRIVSRIALDAATPILAEVIAQKILAHMESHGPHKPAGALEPVTAIGRDYRAWCRHFGIAARVAAGAFDTREDQLRKAAEAIERGDFITCRIPDPES